MTNLRAVDVFVFERQERQKYNTIIYLSLYYSEAEEELWIALQGYSDS